MFTDGASEYIWPSKGELATLCSYPLLAVAVTNNFTGISVGFFHYGMLVSDTVLILTNALGLALNLFYMCCYLLVAPSKGNPLLLLGTCVLYLSGLYSYLYGGYCQPSEVLTLLGTAASTVNVLMGTSPMLDVYTTMQKKEVEFDLFMLWYGLLNSFLWILYGYLLEDPFIALPSTPFFVTGIMKMGLLLAYDRPKQKLKES